MRLGATGKKATLSLSSMDQDNVKSVSLGVNLWVSDLQGLNTIELCNVFSLAKHPFEVDCIPLLSDFGQMAVPERY